MEGANGEVMTCWAIYYRVAQLFVQMIATPSALPCVCFNPKWQSCIKQLSVPGRRLRRPQYCRSPGT